MNLLVVRMGEASFALPEHQVAQLRLWRPDPRPRAVTLAAALGVSGTEPCERALLVRSGGGLVVELGVPASIRQHSAAGTVLTRVPRLLQQLQAPAWLAGFYHLDQELAVVINLRRLADTVAPDQKEQVQSL